MILLARSLLAYSMRRNIVAALNGGALGMTTQHAHSAADARYVVTAAKFPPLGER